MFALMIQGSQLVHLTLFLELRVWNRWGDPNLLRSFRNFNSLDEVFFSPL